MIFVGVREDIGREPSHPSAWSEAATAESVHPHFSQILRGGARDNWCPANTVFPTITKAAGTTSRTGYMSGGHFVRTRDGVERRPTLQEFQALGSFPLQFAFAGRREDGVDRIGNSVPPLLMRSIARHVRTLIA